MKLQNQKIKILQTNVLNLTSRCTSVVENYSLERVGKVKSSSGYVNPVSVALRD